jgi:hypothetical protein
MNEGNTEIDCGEYLYRGFNRPKACFFGSSEELFDNKELVIITFIFLSTIKL